MDLTSMIYAMELIQFHAILLLPLPFFSSFTLLEHWCHSTHRQSSIVSTASTVDDDRRRHYCQPPQSSTSPSTVYSSCSADSPTSDFDIDACRERAKAPEGWRWREMVRVHFGEVHVLQFPAMKSVSGLQTNVEAGSNVLIHSHIYNLLRFLFRQHNTRVNRSPWWWLKRDRDPCSPSSMAWSMPSHL